MLDRLDTLNERRHAIGGNNPPSQIELLAGAQSALAEFLREHPVLANETEAKQAKLMKDRADAAIKDLEDERDRYVRPLNVQVKEINDRYRGPRETFKKVLDALNRRIVDYIRTETLKREAAAEAARKAAEEAERIARERECQEQAALSEQNQGVCDIDVAAKTAEADAAFHDYKVLDRTAKRAERESVVKLGGGFRNRVGLRTVEILAVSDWKSAIDEMGMTDAIRDAILSSARQYRKSFGELPDGITRTEDHTV